jgi:hypothetical protein
VSNPRPREACVLTHLITGRTLEETAALFDGEPVELVEAAGEAATQHGASCFRGRDSVAVINHVDDKDAEFGAGERKEPSALYEHIELSDLSDPSQTVSDRDIEPREHVRSVTFSYP